MGMNCAEDPFNMGMFYNSRYHSKWVCFHILNTHIRAFSYWSCPPGVVEQVFAMVTGCGDTTGSEVVLTRALKVTQQGDRGQMSQN